ncbi:MAG: hypothetical protein OQK11_09505, partial [Thiovulaceae bacterium]|nr:hypothetical protein [Sulfurimonadaceae bacterium]
GGDFEFEKVDSNIGFEEIKKTTLSGASVEEKIDSLIKEDKEESISKRSKIEKIKEAHKLKEDGVLTEEEFKKLKTEILNAN